MAKMFTDEQLLEMAEPPCDKALRALAENDLQRVNELLGEMETGAAGVEALVINSLARFHGEFRQDFGEERSTAILNRAAAHLMRSFADDFLSGKEKTAIVDLLSVFKHQGGANLAPVTETTNEVICKLSPCGSGGRFILDGSVQQWPDWYGPWSDGVTSFCQACKANQRAFNEAVGCEAWTTDISATVPGHCTMRIQKRQGQGSLFFTPHELNEYTKTKARLAQEKLAAGDLNISNLLKDQHLDGAAWHDFQIAQLAYTFSSSYVEGGADYLNDKLASAYNSVFSMFYPYYEQMDDEENVRALCKLHYYHFMTFTVTEEEDRFAFRLDPCGSGGRLYRGQMWRNLFEYGGELSPLMKEAHQVNFYRKDFPLYCSHCSSHNRAQFRDDVLWFINDGRAQSSPEIPCLQYYYKKGKKSIDVDEKLLKQVGL
jgi:hypothetical protein